MQRVYSFNQSLAHCFYDDFHIPYMHTLTHMLLTPHRRRGQKMAIDRLKKALSEYPSGLSLQTTLKAAVDEVAVSGHV